MIQVPDKDVALSKVLIKPLSLPTSQANNSCNIEVVYIIYTSSERLEDEDEFEV